MSAPAYLLFLPSPPPLVVVGRGRGEEEGSDDIWATAATTTMTTMKRVATTTANLSGGGIDEEEARYSAAPHPKRKRVNRKCTHNNCDNRVVQGGVCITHGAQRKCCVHPRCNKAVWHSGFCSAHMTSSSPWEVETPQPIRRGGGDHAMASLRSSSTRTTALSRGGWRSGPSGATSRGDRTPSSATRPDDGGMDDRQRGVGRWEQQDRCSGQSICKERGRVKRKEEEASSKEHDERRNNGAPPRRHEIEINGIKHPCSHFEFDPNNQNVEKKFALKLMEV